ncbi:MAG: S8 family serine peptidase [Candidatus Caldarchaeum sp.]
MQSIASAQNLPPLTQAPKKGHPKLPSILHELVEKYTKNPVQARSFMSQRLHPQQFVGDSVRLLLWPQGQQSANIPKGILKALGATVETESSSLLQVLVPIPKLIALADQLPGVQSIELHVPPKPIQDPILRLQPQTVSEGVNLTGANTYHSAGITGSGVKVAIIDLGFQNIQTAISNGEFGSPHKIDPNCTKDYTTNTTGIAAVDKVTDHGVSVAHVIYNMAPGATLCLKLISTLAQLENAKNDAITEGVKVINHSVGWAIVNSYYDGTGFVDNIAASAFDNDILWVNAAGNDAQHHWQGAWADGDSDSWLNFFGIDECNNISLSAGFFYQFLMNWDAYPSDPIDYDLFLYRINADGSLTLVASSEGFQNGTQPPEEYIGYTPTTSGTYCFAIKRFAGATTPEIEIFIWPDGPGGSPEYNVASSSMPDPANGPKVMAAAAIWHNNWTSGPQESFSSQGPTNTSKFATARVEPAISGPDGTTDYNGTSAFGTSFASPHVAGCAVLIRAANPTFTALQTRTKLETEAIDMGVAGKDNIFGWGRLNCAFAPTNTPALFRIERATGNVYTDGNFISGGADIAEFILASKALQPGEVVELDPHNPRQYRKAQSAYSPLVAGVVSSAPGVVLGAKQAAQEGWALLALVGRVPVKATTENGPIRPGDLLTSASKPGYAMRCASPSACEGALLGKALGALDTGEGVILVLLAR